MTDKDRPIITVTDHRVSRQTSTELPESEKPKTQMEIWLEAIDPAYKNQGGVYRCLLERAMAIGASVAEGLPNVERGMQILKNRANANERIAEISRFKSRSTD